MSKATPAKPRKPYWEMNTAELREATKEFNADMGTIKGRPLTAAERRQFEKAVNRGRPVVGEGSERVLITVERGLLKKADALAKKRKTSRSELIADALRSMVA
jgi:hypothetical protein